MPHRHLRRRWAESRGDEFDAWGPATYWFEVDDQGWPVRQIEVYETGPVLRYGPAHPSDRYGGLGDTSLYGFEDWAPFAVTAADFENRWTA